jgi:hypothetical protein
LRGSRDKPLTVAQPVVDDRPRHTDAPHDLGDAFSAPKFGNEKHAANYACAYLIKHPEKGYPEWVKDMHDVHRYSTSRGFWSTPGEADEPEAVEPVESPPEGEEDQQDAEHDRKAIRERLDGCGAKSVLLRVAECVDEETGEVVERREFIRQIDLPLDEVAVMLGVDTHGKRRVMLTLENVNKLLFGRNADG